MRAGAVRGEHGCSGDTGVLQLGLPASTGLQRSLDAASGCTPADPLADLQGTCLPRPLCVLETPASAPLAPAGGPLILRDYVTGSAQVVGIVSHGPPCDRSAYGERPSLRRHCPAAPACSAGTRRFAAGTAGAAAGALGQETIRTQMAGAIPACIAV